MAYGFPFLQRHMNLAHGGNHGPHSHHQILDQIGNDHNISGIINIDAEVPLHRHDQPECNDDGRRPAAERDQEIRDLAAADLRALKQIAHGTGNHNADRRCNGTID